MRKTTKTTDETVRALISSEFSGEVSVRVRRPNQLYQVSLPAFFGDGDAVSLFVRPGSKGLEVTDLGTTEMRLSYTEELTEAARRALVTLANEHGVEAEGGELVVPVRSGEVLAALLAIIQVQTRAEHIARSASQAERGTQKFRAEALGLLRELFGGALREEHVVESVDPQGLYPLDAYVESSGRQLCFSLVSGTVGAERAVSTRHITRPGLVKASFVALPRDVESLPSMTRRRLVDAYDSVVCSVWNESLAREKLSNIG